MRRITTITPTTAFKCSFVYLLAMCISLLTIPTAIGSGGDAEGAILVPNVLDFGKCAAGDTAAGTMWIINTSDAPITVIGAKGSCGCTTIVDFVSETLEPRQAKELHIRMKASSKHLDQQVTKKVTVTLADGPPVEAQLQIESIHPLYAKLLGYREARKAHATQRIAGYLAEESRIWFDKKEGPGALRKPSGDGPWAEWDREMKSTSTTHAYEVNGNELVTVVSETNDYFKLLDRKPTPYLLTYWFDDEERIEGMLVSSLPKEPKNKGRNDQFKKWADEHHPGVLDELQPDGRIIPSKENAIRWRELLIEWRQDVGLPEVNLGSAE
ncbi:MAG: DUF1573 domain-containing protein [Planctomycetes bacterium]|nr:DUF1573 domain-containing protein [Planctomycetota bacterium]